MLKEAPVFIIQTLLNFFYQSWRTSHLPYSWSEADIVPIQKSFKYPILLNSYRPISFTPLHCNVFEGIVDYHLLCELETKNLLHRNHMAFDNTLLEKLYSSFPTDSHKCLLEETLPDSHFPGPY